jgi:hypothetical protein
MKSSCKLDTWEIETGHMSQVIVTEDEKQAMELKDEGWLDYFSPEHVPGIELNRPIWIMYRPKGSASSDTMQDLWTLIVEFLGDYQIPFDDELNMLFAELYRKWLNLQYRIKRRQKILSQPK